MRSCKYLIACLSLAVAAVAVAQNNGQKLPILDKFQGKVNNDMKPKLRTNFIASEKVWKEVWGAVNPQAKLPMVDFTKHILLVSTQDAADPNRRGVSVVKDDKGVITLNEISTLIGFQPSNQTIYTFYKVSRAGVTGVRRFDPAAKQMVVEALPQ